MCLNGFSKVVLKVFWGLGSPQVFLRFFPFGAADC